MRFFPALRKFLTAVIAGAVGALVLIGTTPGRAIAQNVACYLDQGGSAFHVGSGCTWSVESGGTAGANSGSTVYVVPPLTLGATSATAAGADTFVTKRVTAVADNTATTVLTVSVPNAAHSATIPIVINAALGAGGAVGADECTATAYGQIVLTRTSGVATVATATTLADTGSACVAGATTVTLAYSVTSMTGANSATQTFNIQVTVAHGGGSSTNHIVAVQADVLNMNGSGITIS